MKKVSKNLFKFYWNFLKEQKGFFFLMVIISQIVWPISLTILPQLKKSMVDMVEKNPQIDVLVFLTPMILIVLFKILTDVLNRVYDLMWIFFITKLRKNIQKHLFSYTSGQSYSYFAKRMSGSISQSITAVASETEKVFSFFISLFCPLIIAVIMQFIITTKIKHLFGIISAGRFMLHIIVGRLMGPRALNASKEYSGAFLKVAGNINDSISNFINAKAFGSSTFEANHIENHLEEEYTKKRRALMWTLGVKVSLNFIDDIILIVLFYSLVRLKMSGEVSYGDFFLIYELHSNFSRATTWISSQMAPISQSIGNLRGYLERLSVEYSITDLEGAPNLKVDGGQITFKNVSFGYENEKLFEKFNLAIKRREKIGLIGESGAGKTSLLNLIMRFYDPSSGLIEIDGQNIAEVKQNSLRRNISLVTQDPLLFNRSVAQNIAYGFENIDYDLVKKCAKRAYCHDFISAMKDGYDSKVGERGISLSGGQRQRISIAKAMYKNAPILILDEATSALDSETEAYIQSSIRNLIKNRTTIAIAHRLSTIVNLDRLIVIKDGEILEEGSHDQLLKNNGYYSRLWNMQSNGFLVYDEPNSDQ